jgi:predicted transcriptional regulator
MLRFKQYLAEAKEGKNLHLEHLEDEVLNGGINGTRAAINFLRSLRDMLAGHSKKSVNVTVKWDGAPAVFAGTNPENGKFFVGTKGVFNKNPKVNYTDADIDANHSSAGLNAKLKVALKYLPSLGIKKVLQGDLLFTQDDLSTETIDGKSYITFTPNTITYAVPKESSDKIKKAKMGIVWHTTYSGDTLQDMRASFGASISGLKQTKDVYFTDADYRDTSGTVNFNKAETDGITSVLSLAGKTFQKFNSKFTKDLMDRKDVVTLIKTFNNVKVREGQKISNTSKHTQELIKYVDVKMQKNIDSVKTQKTKDAKQKIKDDFIRFLSSNKGSLKIVFDMQNLLTVAKNFIIRKLEMARGVMDTFIRTDNGYRVTAPEGFVAIDQMGDAVKLVDRLEFSRANFNAAKAWDK